LELHPSSPSPSQDQKLRDQKLRVAWNRITDELSLVSSR
jgi:hypothetical protein